jgi:nucleoside-triphosphatase THEP1
MQTKQPRIVIVTAPQHSGKSSLIARYVEQCHQHRVHTAGILAEGLWEGNQRSGFNLVDLSSGVRVPLAVRCAPHGQARIRFEFFQAGIDAGMAALDTERCAAANLIVVDEVGKLEVMGQGWAPYLPPLLELPVKTHIWVVRESLVEAVAKRWALSPLAVVDARNEDALNELIDACALFGR